MKITDIEKIQVLLIFSRGSKSRRKIMDVLGHNPKNCNQIAKETRLDWWTVQKHIQQLLREKLVKKLSFGQRTFYSITDEGKQATIICAQYFSEKG